MDLGWQGKDTEELKEEQAKERPGRSISGEQKSFFLTFIYLFGCTGS